MFKDNRKYILSYLVLMLVCSLIAVNETAYHESTSGFLLNAAGLFLLVTILHMVFITPNAFLILTIKLFRKEVPDKIPSWLSVVLFAIGLVLLIYTMDYTRPIYKTFQDYTLTIL